MEKVHEIKFNLKWLKQNTNLINIMLHPMK